VTYFFRLLVTTCMVLCSRDVYTAICMFVADSMGLDAVNLTQLGPKTVVLREITRNGGHWAVQGHPRSSILVPIESPCAISCQYSYHIARIGPNYCFSHNHRGYFCRTPEIWTAKLGLKIGTSLYRVIPRESLV